MNGESVAVGGLRLVADMSASIPSEIDKTASAWASEGKTVLYAVRDSAVIGALAVEDEIRPESAETVRLLRLKIGWKDKDAQYKYKMKQKLREWAVSP